jgi:hypothetical protein
MYLRPTAASTAKRRNSSGSRSSSSSPERPPRSLTPSPHPTLPSSTGRVTRATIRMLKDGARASVSESGSAPSSPLVGHQCDDEDGKLSSSSQPVTASTSQLTTDTQLPANRPSMSMSVTSAQPGTVSSTPLVSPLVSPCAPLVCSEHGHSYARPLFIF